MFLTRRLRSNRSYAAYPDNLSAMSLLMLSNHFRFGLPLVLYPGAFTMITLLPTYYYSLLMTISLQHMFLYLLGYYFHLRCPSTYFIHFLFCLVTPHIHLNIICQHFFMCTFFTANVSAPYNITGLTTVLYPFPLTIKLIIMSLRTADNLIQFADPGSSMCVTAESKLPFSSDIDHTY